MVVAACGLLLLSATACRGGHRGGQLLFALPGGIFQYQIDGGRLKLLLAPVGGGVTIRDPAISPDGKRIAYIRAKTGASAEVWLANRDGSDAHPAYQQGAAGGQAAQPIWSDRGHVLVMLGGGAASELARVDVATGERVKVLDSVLAFGVSRDGRQIAYAQSGAPGVPLALQLATSDGSHLRTLVGSDQQVVRFDSPRFSGDSKQVLFGAAHPSDAAEEIWSVDTLGSAPQRVARIADGASSLALAADGAHAYVASASVLYEVSLRGAPTRRLLDTGVASAVAWAP
jgi:Tol biopolymer transport system component